MIPIFLTGATGIAGSWAAQELARRGLAFRALARKIPASPPFDWVEGDLKPAATLERLARPNCGIVHYACASLRGRDDPQVDIDAMNALLRTWEQGAFVFISSIDVYGGPAVDVVHESHPLSGRRGPYAQGKIACEALLFENARRRGREDFTILRAPWIFAPSARSRQHIESRFLQCFPGDVTLPSSKRVEFIDTWVDARDLAWLAVQALERPLGGAGNVVGGIFRWTEFFESLLPIAGQDKKIRQAPPELCIPYAAELFGQTCRYDDSKVKEHFGFEPRHSLKETLSQAFRIQESECP